MDLHGRGLLKSADLTAEEFVFLTGLAGRLRADKRKGVTGRRLAGRNIALIFEKTSTRTRSAFEVAAHDEGGMGIWGSVAGLGAAAGVLLGGVLTTSLGWRWTLFVNVPIGVACAAAAPHLIVESRAPDQGQGFDLAGAATVTAGLGALVYGLVGASSAGWSSPRTIGSLAAAAVLLGAFVVIEQRARAPLFPFSIFRHPVLRAANVIMLPTGAALLSLFFVLSLYEQQVLRYSALDAGLSQLPLAVTIVAAAGLASRATSRAGLKPTLLPGWSCSPPGWPGSPRSPRPPPSPPASWARRC